MGILRPHLSSFSVPFLSSCVIDPVQVGAFLLFVFCFTNFGVILLLNLYLFSLFYWGFLFGVHIGLFNVEFQWFWNYAEVLCFIIYFWIFVWCRKVNSWIIGGCLFIYSITFLVNLGFDWEASCSRILIILE